MESDSLTIQSLRDKKLILSTLFNDHEASMIRFDPVFDWKLMFDPDSADVALSTGEGEQLFRIAMQAFGNAEEERYIVCLVEK